jgi:hypothetical protein
MKLERRLVVARHQAKIRAVGLGVVEIAEIRQRQAHQHRHILRRAGDVGAGRRQVEADFLAVLPIVVPPRRGQRDDG